MLIQINIISNQVNNEKHSTFGCLRRNYMHSTNRRRHQRYDPLSSAPLHRHKYFELRTAATPHLRAVPAAQDYGRKLRHTSTSLCRQSEAPTTCRKTLSHGGRSGQLLQGGQARQEEVVEAWSSSVCQHLPHRTLKNTRKQSVGFCSIAGKPIQIFFNKHNSLPVLSYPAWVDHNATVKNVQLQDAIDVHAGYRTTCLNLLKTNVTIQRRNHYNTHSQT